MANKYFIVGKGIQSGGKKIVEGLKKVFSKKQPTITGMKPTPGQKETRNFKMGAGITRLNKSIEEVRKAKQANKARLRVNEKMKGDK